MYENKNIDLSLLCRCVALNLEYKLPEAMLGPSIIDTPDIHDEHCLEGIIYIKYKNV